jgi:excisionase family DNA binding protein
MEDKQVIPGPGENLQAKEVAASLNCHVSTVYELVEKGRLRAFSLMGRTAKGKRGKKGLRILASSVRDLIASGLNKADEPPPPEEVAIPPSAVTPPPRRSGRSKSRVVLPYPGQSRLASPATTPSPQTDGCTIAVA